MPILTSLNPATNQPLGQVPTSPLEEVQQRVEMAQKAKLGWQFTPLMARIDFLEELFNALNGQQQLLARTISQEMGMPIRQSRDEVASALHYFRWYLDNAPIHLAPEVSFENEAHIHTVHYEPCGVAAVIVPWNFPLSNFIWGVIPHLLVGNVVVFKHSEVCPLFGKYLDELIYQAELPPGVLCQVYGDGGVGQMLLSQPLDILSFTGSSQTGSQLYAQAGQKGIPSVLETGGSAPGIIFPSVNLPTCLENVYTNRFSNTGQMYDALKRLLVSQDLLETSVTQLTELLKNKIVGSPIQENTDIGPLASAQQRETLTAQVDDAVRKGATLIQPIQDIPSEGNFYPPTLILNPTPDMRIWQEELFGPVLPIISFEDEAQAVRQANHTPFGLGAYIYSQDLAQAKRVAMEIETGMVSINGVDYVEPFNPFGGRKNSGIGRQHGRHGFHGLCQLKVVSMPKM